ncbi:hypothetical protein AURDEDRAFT_125163 [Auricularia subglabra TFB-10046 SS5]|uniref:Uncharacterized protein n=1 Tax=Auricularia subglabra (strain TFB-10046 / SS5) TaxID=717982 RepID=J0DDU1_AURST|nr:hypothetical protein AURDEDRAFT_125163 [Auricularia subglabra TFB-10046 SS5]
MLSFSTSNATSSNESKISKAILNAYAVPSARGVCMLTSARLKPYYRSASIEIAKPITKFLLGIEKEKVALSTRERFPGAADSAAGSSAAQNIIKRLLKEAKRDLYRVAKGTGVEVKDLAKFTGVLSADILKHIILAPSMWIDWIAKDFSSGLEVDEGERVERSGWFRDD